MQHDGLILGFAIAFRQQRAVEVLVITAHRQARAATAQVECIVTSFVPALLACYPGSNSFALDNQGAGGCWRMPSLVGSRTENEQESSRANKKVESGDAAFHRCVLRFVVA